MNFIDNVKKRAKKDKKTIVLPESMDERVIEAASKVIEEDIANIIIIGDKEEIDKNYPNYDISKAKIINPESSELTEDLINHLVELRKHKGMTYEEAIQMILPGRYRHFKGNEYEVIGLARHSETMEPMVVYRALYGEGGLWTRPAAMWYETVTRDGKSHKRFERIG